MKTEPSLIFLPAFILLVVTLLYRQDQTSLSSNIIESVNQNVNILHNDHIRVDDTVPRKSPCDKTYSDFLRDLRDRESSGNYFAINSLNFIGAYQFGEAALIDLGYVHTDDDVYDNDYGGGFTGKNGIESIADFLMDPKVQDDAAREWMQIMWTYIEADGLSKFTWQQIGDITLSPSAMLASSHLLGTGALRRFIESKGRANIQDPFGTSLKSYIDHFNGYNVPFIECGPNAAFES